MELNHIWIEAKNILDHCAKVEASTSQDEIDLAMAINKAAQIKNAVERIHRLTEEMRKHYDAIIHCPIRKNESLDSES